MVDRNCCVSGLAGVPQGVGTACQATQACCLGDGTCSMLDTIVCVNQFGGTPMGPNVTCTASQACCMPDGSCQNMDPLCCARAGGTSNPGGGSCLGDTNADGVDEACPARCCQPSGTCSEISSADCQAAGGSFSVGKGCLGDANGDGKDDGCCDCQADLDGNTVVNFNDVTVVIGCVGQPPTGNCAAADVTCDGVIDADDINAAVCAFQQNPGCCEPCLCDGDADGNSVVNFADVYQIILCDGQPATGPCASRDLNCDGLVNHVDIDAAVCIFQGFGDCCAPRGSCCLGDGGCATTTEAACAAVSGSFNLNGTCAGDVQACCYSADVNDNGITNFVDVQLIIQCYGQPPTGARYQMDVNCDCTIDQDDADVAICVFQGGMDCCTPTGACCQPDGSCQIVTQAQCDTQGGAYHGDDAQCAGSVEACCYDSGGPGGGACAVADLLCCAVDLGGVPLGAGSTCGDEQACCLSGGGCEDLSLSCCFDAQGTPLGTASTCAIDGAQLCGTCLCFADVDRNGTVNFVDVQQVILCEDQAPVGACEAMDLDCDGDIDPDDVSAAVCRFTGGVDCCGPRGACCLDAPTGCIVTTQGDCQVRSGFFQGLNTECGGAPEACCIDGGAVCAEVDATCCAGVLGGTPLGTGSGCLAPEACCLPDESCAALDPSCCAYLFGTPAAAGSVCEGGPGPDPLCGPCVCQSDVDGNGTVNFADVQKIILCYYQQPTGACANMDVDCDGVIGPGDANAAICAFQGGQNCCADCACHGDVNESGAINFADVFHVIQCIGSPPFGACQRMDVNCNGVIDIDDAETVICMWLGQSDCCVVAVPVGACCVGFQCSLQTLTECSARGGNYKGDGTKCTLGSCGLILGR